MQTIITFFILFIIVVSVDLIWLGWLAKDLYRKELGSHMGVKFNWLAAGLFYLMFPVAIMIFPLAMAKSLTDAVILGGLFGLFTYATYELTNWAIIKDWPVKIVIIDVIWGIILCGTATSVAYFLMTAF